MHDDGRGVYAQNTVRHNAKAGFVVRSSAQATLVVCVREGAREGGCEKGGRQKGGREGGRELRERGRGSVGVRV